MAVRDNPLSRAPYSSRARNFACLIWIIYDDGGEKSVRFEDKLYVMSHIEKDVSFIIDHYADVAYI